MNRRKDAGDRLFRLVEEAQGYAFISDGIDGLPDVEVLRIAKQSLGWTLETAKKLRGFIRSMEVREQEERQR